MNPERDVDQILKHYLDDGADRAPERFVWAALEETERIAQRAAWQASREGFLMKLKTAAPYLGVAAAILLAIAAFRLFVSPSVGGPSPSQVPSEITADLKDIVITDSNIPEGLTVYRTHTGIDALNASNIAPEDSPGFMDAVLTEFDGDEVHEGDHEDRYRTFAAEFENVADAERAFDAAVAALVSADSWGLPFADAIEADLGDESKRFVKGRDYGYPLLSVYLWRSDNLLLQAVDFHPYDRPDLLRSIAEGMDARAR